MNETQFLPFNIEIPRHPAGFVYMLVSRSVPNCVYIGETINLRRRLREHNSGLGASFTNVPERRPWAVFCFVTGFNDEGERKDCERFWHNQLAYTFRGRRVAPSTIDCYQIGLKIQEQLVNNNKELKLVVCGRLITEATELV